MEFKTDRGALTEDEVQAAVEAAFSADFVFRSPRHKGGRELTDVLVLFDDVGLVIEAKAQAAGSSTGLSSPTDWAAKTLAKAGRQVDGAVRALRDGRVRFVENVRRGRVPFDVKDLPYLYGLIVMEHESEPYDPFQLVPDLRNMKAPVTVLSFRDFWNLTEFLDTPTDLMNYFEHRPEVLVPTLSPKVHEEAKAFGYYVERLEDVMEVRARGQGRALPADGFLGYAQELRKVVRGEHPDYAAGLVIDHMIDRLHDLDPDLTVLDKEGRGGVGGEGVVYAQVATELAKIPRVSRIVLGAIYLKMAALAAETGQECHHVSHSPGRHDCMVFVASPLGQDERAQRADNLLALTSLAKAYHGADRAIGIATEAAGELGTSYDFVLLQGPPTQDEEAQKLGREMFGEGKRLVPA